jgi:hypothetical protein
VRKKKRMKKIGLLIGAVPLGSLFGLPLVLGMDCLCCGFDFFVSVFTIIRIPVR